MLHRLSEQVTAIKIKDERHGFWGLKPPGGSSKPTNKTNKV